MIWRMLSILAIISLLCAGGCHTAAGKGGAAKAEGESGADAGAKGERKLEAKVRRLIADEFGVADEEVGMDSSLTDDLNADDNDKTSLIERLEEEFNLSIPPEDAEKIKTVKDACEYVKQHRRK